MKRKIITFIRILHNGTVNFIRNFGISSAAMAVIIITLTIVLISFIVNATFNNTINQITSKIDISVYLKDSVTSQQTNQLISEMKHLNNVANVQYLNKAQVLRQYELQNASNHQLALAITETSNPLPATIHIRVKNLNNLSGIRYFLDQSNIKSLQSNPPSYSGSLKQAIDNISHVTDVLKKLSVIAIIIFGFVSILIIFNTIQMAIFNRKDEIQIMRLLGATTSFIRGPFIVESTIYGLLSAILSVIIVNFIFVTANSTLQASSLGLLDINFATTYFDEHFWQFLGIQIAMGVFIGATSSWVATRRYLKFKVNN
ncbi:MAG: permease-like cell division protein FtsX [Patescibacteria group bacterium]|jgi:cell division transport system permease protein|nr:permease-like cell division protein FtsX [Patescibacteria group bacterium]